MAAKRLTEPGLRLVGDAIWIDPVDGAEIVVGEETDQSEIAPEEKPAQPAVTRGLRRVRFPQGELTFSGLLDRMRLRHHGPGPHPGTGTPQSVHAGDGGDGEKDKEGPTRVGITAARPGMSEEQVRRRLDRLIKGLERIDSVTDVYAAHCLGSYAGGREASYLIEYEGDGEARRLMADFGEENDQDSVLLLRPAEGKGDAPLTDISLGTRVGRDDQERLNTVLAEAGLAYWTWYRQRGAGTALRVACVPEYGGTPDAHNSQMEAVMESLAEAGFRPERKDYTIHPEVVWHQAGEGRTTYDSVQEGAESD
jgi:hypothetical protein